jgi:acyl-coenzyme A synthetase/AMP-(fatty) acid ligase
MSPSASYEIPEKLNMVELLCDKWIKKGIGEKIAIYSEGKNITWNELIILVNKFGNALKNMGITKGDKIIIRSPNLPESYISFLACVKIGAVPIPISTLLGIREIKHIVDNSDAVLAISTLECVKPLDKVKGETGMLRNIIIIGEVDKNYLSFEKLIEASSSKLETAETKKNDVAFMLYTSGTTGLPKGVVHLHQSAVGIGEIGKTWKLTPDDIILHPHQLAFSFSLAEGFINPFYHGSAVVSFPFRVTPEKICEYIKRFKVTVLFTVPTTYRMINLYLDKYDESVRKEYLSSLRFCGSSGEPLDTQTFNKWKQNCGLDLYEFLGTTETFRVIATLPGMKIKPGSMGKPISGYPIRIVNKEGKDCKPYERGQLVVKSDHPCVFSEYRKMPKKTREALGGGWYKTGDLAYFDEEGYIWFVSREDDIIKSRGYFIAPKEIEDIIVKHPAVSEVCVVGSPDPIIKERIKAFIVLSQGYSPLKEIAEDIRNYVMKEIALFKVPKEIEFMDSLPKSPTGKILRRKLRELEKVNRKAKAKYSF